MLLGSDVTIASILSESIFLGKNGKIVTCLYGLTQNRTVDQKHITVNIIINDRRGKFTVFNVYLPDFETL